MFRIFAILIAFLSLSVSLVSCGATDPDVQAKIDAARARNDGPPMWRVRGDDSLLYLFGTVHLLPEDFDWQRDDMRAAFDKAGTVFFETSSDEAAIARAQVITAADGYYSGRQRLTQRLGGYEQKLLFAATLNAGLKDGALDKMQPWLAADTLSFAELNAAGMHKRFGADAVLLSRAKARGKYIRYLEDMDAHLAATRVLPERLQLDALREAMQSAGELTVQTQAFNKEWARGNARYIASQIAPLKQGMPDYYDALFTHRNTQWTEQFADFLDTGGTGFAAIGTGHLVGPDSVVDMLKDKGFNVERYYAYRGDNVIKTIDLSQ